jgi:DHA2 family multidrug resistance protein
MARGADPSLARHQAYGAVWGMVQQQAATVSFVDSFMAMAVVFLLVLPLLLIMKRPKHHARGAAMH